VLPGDVKMGDESQNLAARTTGTAFGPASARKILVTGLGRGGTSSIASMLFHAGFNVCGEVTPGANFEDDHLRSLLLAREYDQVLQELESRVARYPLVAWKDPKLYSAQGLELVRRLPADWVLIAVYRDPVAIVSRRMVADQVDFAESLPHVIRYMRKLDAFVSEVGKTKKVVYVSYEKVVTDPVTTLGGICSMLGARVEPAEASRLWALMQQSQQQYLRHQTKLRADDRNDE
jgi:hypothetical protein